MKIVKILKQALFPSPKAFTIWSYITFCPTFHAQFNLPWSAVILWVVLPIQLPFFNLLEFALMPVNCGKNEFSSRLLENEDFFRQTLTERTFHKFFIPDNSNSSLSLITFNYKKRDPKTMHQFSNALMSFTFFFLSHPKNCHLTPLFNLIGKTCSYDNSTVAMKWKWKWLQNNLWRTARQNSNERIFS